MLSSEGSSETEDMVCAKEEVHVYKQEASQLGCSELSLDLR